MAAEPSVAFEDGALTDPNVDAGARIEAAMREISRLRETLERSEEQLWETKGQLLLDRERMAVLEHELAAGPAEPTMTEAAHHSIMNAVYKELSALEYGVRAQIARLERIERAVEGWSEEGADAAESARSSDLGGVHKDANQDDRKGEGGDEGAAGGGGTPFVPA